MQLTIQFSFEKEQNWNFDQYILQWLFYNAIKDTKQDIHWNKLWLYTFSNIYPFEKWKNYQIDKNYTMSVKSVKKDIIMWMYEYFSLNNNLKFGLENNIKIKKAFITKTEPFFVWKLIKWITPIVLSMDKGLAEKYNITYNRNWKPLYWNKNMWFEIFVKQLIKNIIKKYVYILNELISWNIEISDLSYDIKNSFWKLENWEKNLLEISNNIEEFDKFVDNIDLFKGYKFKRWALLSYKWWKIAGSLWDFVVWENLENLDVVKILKTTSLMWFGERTTAGFGFIK